MKALAALSKYLGCYDQWNDIREKYQLKWSSEDGFEAFNDIMIDNGESYSSMVNWLKHAMSKLPLRYANILLFNTLIGLRPDEACKSVKLLNECQQRYANEGTMVLEILKLTSALQ